MSSLPAQKMSRYSTRAAPQIHHRGVTDVPGLYFLGLQRLSKKESALTTGVGYDAGYLADHIVATG
jgi:putative flavoprotein involved in K+ transport